MNAKKRSVKISDVFVTSFSLGKVCVVVSFCHFRRAAVNKHSRLQVSTSLSTARITITTVNYTYLLVHPYL